MNVPMMCAAALIALFGLPGSAPDEQVAAGVAWGGGTQAVQEPAPSPELARRAAGKLAGLTARDRPRRITLSQVELQSLVRYRLPKFLPSYIEDPRAEMEAGRVRVSAQIPTTRLAAPSLSRITAMMPEAVRLSADGELVPLDAGHVAFEVHAMSAAGFPLSERLIPAVLERLGRQPRPGLAPNAVALPLPAGVSRVFVNGDALVLVPAR